ALLLCGAVATGFWYQHDRAERAAARLRAEAQLERDVGGLLHEASAYADQARAARGDPARWEALLATALSAVSRAEALADGERGPPPAGLGERLRKLRAALEAEEKDRRLVARLDAIELAHAQTYGPEALGGVPRMVADYRSAFADYGMVVGRVPPA